MSVNSLPWYYVQDLPSLHDTAILTGDEWHHCLHVMRMRIGEALILFDGKGHGYEGIIRKETKSMGEIELMQDLSNQFVTSQKPYINIAFAPAKNIDRNEVAIEKIVELGVNKITFLHCDHGERDKLRPDRLMKIVISAAKQSRKLLLPELIDFQSPAELMENEKMTRPNLSILCCHLDPQSKSLHHTYEGQENVLALIGPEGGFSTREIENIQANGGHLITLGPHRLRVETAAITACAQIHLLYDLKHTS